MADITWGDVAASAANFGTQVNNSAEQLIKKQARFDLNKINTQFQKDADAYLRQLQTDGSNYQDWGENVNNFLNNITSQMGNKKSPYYCRNQYTADEAKMMLSGAQESLQNKVLTMQLQYQKEQNGVDYQQMIQNNREIYPSGGQQLLQADLEALNSYSLINGLSPEQLAQQKALIYKDAYVYTGKSYLDSAIETALSEGKSFNQVWEGYSAIEKPVMPNGERYDSEGYDKAIKKEYEQVYKAKQMDLWNTNANKLSQVYADMMKTDTNDKKRSLARYGQNLLNAMGANSIDEDRRNQYARLFAYTDAVATSGGSGGSKKTSDKFSELIKASPETGLQLYLEGYGNVYEMGAVMSEHLTNEFLTNDYQENINKNGTERQDMLEDIYRYDVAENTLTDAIFQKVVDRFPETATLLNNNCSKLIADMKAHPEQYGAVTVGELSKFLVDCVNESTVNTTDKDIIEKLNKHINDCYVSKVKQVELKNGKLRDTYNPKKPKDIAKAAKLVHEHDFVFTDAEGNDIWNKERKEALEAEGGVVDVLRQATASTLNVSPDELEFHYKKTAYDMESVPIFRYQGQDYEVLPSSNNKGYVVKNVTSGTETEGVKATDNKKKQAAQDVKTAQQQRFNTEQKMIVSDKENMVDSMDVSENVKNRFRRGMGLPEKKEEHVNGNRKHN